MTNPGTKVGGFVEKSKIRLVPNRTYKSRVLLANAPSAQPPHCYRFVKLLDVELAVGVLR